MARAETKSDPFETRRRKEHVAFLVVKFLRAAVVFRAISDEFETFTSSQSLEGCGLFGKVQELVTGQLFDLKERAHALFRSDMSMAKGRRSGARSSSETRSLDSHIGTGYHLLLILQETLYQIERYAPELEKEKDDASAKIASDAEELALRVMERCRTLFGLTTEVILEVRHRVPRQRDPHPQPPSEPGPRGKGVREGRGGSLLLSDLPWTGLPR